MLIGSLSWEVWLAEGGLAEPAGVVSSSVGSGMGRRRYRTRGQVSGSTMRTLAVTGAGGVTEDGCRLTS